MATSCGSPCYAAPELVVSDGLYVGSAVDIWSCGVILYAMLSGYLPFDDDPENPDGDNINLLYKYIINTPLTFPDWISPTARDLLSSMLVPNPEHRCTLTEIMNHPWLIPFRPLFARSVDDLEGIAQEQMQYKRQTSRKDMQARMKARDTARLNYLAQSAGVAPGQVPQKSKAAPQDHQRRHKSDMPMGMGLQSAHVSVPQGPSPIATAAAIPTFANQYLAGSSNLTSSTPTTGHATPLSESLPTGSSVNNGTRPRAEEDADVDPILAEGEVRASARQRADDGRQTSTLRMGEVTPKRSDGITAASNEHNSSPGSGSPASKKRPSPQTKNRHTIQVEYDGEVAYARLLEVQAEKDKFRGAKPVEAVEGNACGMQIDEAESTPTLPTSRTSPVPLAPILTSDGDDPSKVNTSTTLIFSPHSRSPEKMDVDPTTPGSSQQGQLQPSLTTAPSGEQTTSEANALGSIPMPASPTMSPSMIRLVPPTPSKEPSVPHSGGTGSPSAVHKKAHSDTALKQEHRSSPSLTLLPVPSRTASGSSVSDSISSANTQSPRLEPSHDRPRVSIDTNVRQLSTSSTASLTLAETSPGVSLGSQEGMAASKANAKKERSRKGMTMNSFGFGKLLSSTGLTSDTVFNSGDAKDNTGFLYRRESTRDKAKRRANVHRQEGGDEGRRTHSISAADSCPYVYHSQAVML